MTLRVPRGISLELTLRFLEKRLARKSVTSEWRNTHEPIVTRLASVINGCFNAR